jgi:hypothetical protein
MKKSNNPFQMKIGQASIVLLALIFSVFTQKSTAQELPNILWISVEDISPDIGIGSIGPRRNEIYKCDC